MAENLKDRTVKGVIWSAIQKSGTILLNFISSIILARLLSPADYGCIGMLAIFLAISNTFIDGGFGSALIQKKRPTDEDYSTIFYWNLFLSVVLYVVLFFSAPAIAQFYKQDILCEVLRVHGVVLIINAARIVQTNQLRKQLRFNKIAAVNISVSAFSLVVTIFLAWKGFGVWSLVAQQLLVSLLTTIIYWTSSKWRPLRVFSKQSFKELFNFGGFVLLSNLINTLCNNIQGVLIGRLYDPVTMGYYSKAKSTEELSSTFISQIMEQVSYPVLAEAQNDKQYMIRMLKKFICVLAYITFPLMMILILLAKPIFLLLYSDRWLLSVPYFQILCVAGIAICLQGINYHAVAAIGKSKDQFVWTLVKRGLGLMFVLGGLAVWQLKGLLAGMVLTSWTIYVINAFLVHKYIGYRLWQQFVDLLPTLMVSLASFGCGLAINYFSPISNVYLVGILQFAVFCMVYFCGSILFKIESFVSTKDIVLMFVRKYRKK